jgi:hypothetical protein
MCEETVERKLRSDVNKMQVSSTIGVADIYHAELEKKTASASLDSRY